MNKREMVEYLTNHIEVLQRHVDYTDTTPFKHYKGVRLNEAQRLDHNKMPRLRNRVIEELYRCRRELVRLKAIPEHQIETIGQYLKAS